MAVRVHYRKCLVTAESLIARALQSSSIEFVPGEHHCNKKLWSSRRQMALSHEDLYSYTRFTWILCRWYVLLLRLYLSFTTASARSSYNQKTESPFYQTDENMFHRKEKIEAKWEANNVQAQKKNRNAALFWGSPITRAYPARRLHINKSYRVHEQQHP